MSPLSSEVKEYTVVSRPMGVSVLVFKSSSCRSAYLSRFDFTIVSWYFLSLFAWKQKALSMIELLLFTCNVLSSS